MLRLTARSHYLGNPYDKENAEYIASLFSNCDYETEIATYEVLFPTPKMRQLELLEPVKYTARLIERPLAEDATSQQVDEHLPVYNAFSTDGDVTAEVVYVNYGIPADYEELERVELM